MPPIHLSHLGESGLLVRIGDASLALDPPEPSPHPTLLTWSEAERVAGARGAPALAAPPELLAFLGLPGLSLNEDEQPIFGGFRLRVTRYPPIPYATAAEALRKTRSALRDPRLAARRLCHTLRRPRGLPLAVSLFKDGQHVAILAQSLHRFLPPDALARLVDRHGGADLTVAGTDYDDEQATGRALHAFGPGAMLLADLVGPVRRRLGLPVRPLTLAQGAARPGTGILAPLGSWTGAQAPQKETP